MTDRATTDPGPGGAASPPTSGEQPGERGAEEGAPPAGAATGERGASASSAALRGYLERCDAEVEEALARALGAASRLELVRAVHNRVRPTVTVHDDALAAVVCPRLAEVPGGGPVADRLRRGCRERAALLARFEGLSRHVAAPYVSSVSGTEVEEILAGLARSFRVHAEEETPLLAHLLGTSGGAAEAAALVAALADEIRRAPTRLPPNGRVGASATTKALRRLWGRVEDWSDTHWGWGEAPRRPASPRTELVAALQREADVSPPSIRALLEGYDAAIDAIVAEQRLAQGTEAEAAAAHRLLAAVAIHDSVVAGVLAPLLAAVPRGAAAAERMRRGCAERAAIQLRWDELARGLPPAQVYRRHRPEAAGLVAELATRFAEHEREGTLEATSVLEPLPQEAYRTWTSPLSDALWPWHSEGPAALAVRMALWTEAAPTRAHAAAVRHPSSHLLRSAFHLVDYFRDRWQDGPVQRWLHPELPPRPLADLTDAPSAPTGPTATSTATGTAGDVGERPTQPDPQA